MLQEWSCEEDRLFDDVGLMRAHLVEIVAEDYLRGVCFRVKKLLHGSGAELDEAKR